MREVIARTIATTTALVIALGASPGVMAQQQTPAPKDARPTEKFNPSAPLAQPRSPQPAPGGGPPDTLTPDVPTGPVFDGTSDLARWIEETRPKAAAGRRRLLIILGTNTDEMGPKLKALLSTPDNTRLLSAEFDTFWAEIAQGERAKPNLELAAKLDKKFKAGEMPYLMILDDKGELVAGRSSSKMLDLERSRSKPVYMLTRVQEFLTENMTDRLDVASTVSDAARSAGAEGKALFVWFGEREERWSERFEQLLQRPDVRAVMEKHVRVLGIDLSRTDKGWSYVEGIMPSPQSLPLFMTTSPSGRPIALSQPPGKTNIGMPTDSEEIARLVAMLRAAAPKMTDGEATELSKALLLGSSEKPAVDRP